MRPRSPKSTPPVSTPTLVAQNNPSIGPSDTEIHGQHIASAGLGLRFSRGTNTSFRLDAGTVMDGGGTQKIGDVRIHGSFAYIF